MHATHQPANAARVPAQIVGNIPVESTPEKTANHEALMKKGHEVLKDGFETLRGDAAAAARVKQKLATWAQGRQTVGDPNKVLVSNGRGAPIAGPNGNAPLEMAWFAGCVMRSAQILKDKQPSLWSDIKGEFIGWTDDTIRAKYLDPLARLSGVSNRKASLMEANLRIASLKGVPAWIKLHFDEMKTFANRYIETTEIQVPDGAGGHRREVLARIGREDGSNASQSDDMRDLYHPQFGLASLLQATALAAKLQRQHPEVDLSLSGPEKKKLGDALTFMAQRNLNAADPSKYPHVHGYPTSTNADGTPMIGNFDIPMWNLASWFFGHAGLGATPAAIGEMERKNREALPSGMAIMWTRKNEDVSVDPS